MLPREHLAIFGTYLTVIPGKRGAPGTYLVEARDAVHHAVHRTGLPPQIYTHNKELSDAELSDSKLSDQ